MKICGLISSKEEAKEIDFMARTLVVANRARLLAKRGRYDTAEKKLTADNLSG